jgi:tetratricopeptide (TPR) repeat protein
MANKLQEAESAYLKVLSMEADNITALSGLAATNVRRHQFEKAGDYYHQILKLDTTDHQVYRQLGLLTTKDTAAKINYLRKANLLSPTDPEIAVELSDVYIQRKDFGPAEDVLETALATDTANLLLLKKMMPVSIGMKKYRSAITLGERILAYRDSSAVVLNNLGRSYYAMFEFARALRCFIAIKNPSALEEEELFYNIAACYRELRDYKNEETYLDKAIKQGISPKTASYYGLLGDSFDNRNMAKEAMDAYKKGLLFENTGSLLYSIAQVYENKLNDKKSAIDYYSQYLKTLDPKERPKLIKYINNKIAELTERSKK